MSLTAPVTRNPLAISARELVLQFSPLRNLAATCWHAQANIGFAVVWAFSRSAKKLTLPEIDSSSKLDELPSKDVLRTGSTAMFQRRLTAYTSTHAYELIMSRGCCLLGKPTPFCGSHAPVLLWMAMFLTALELCSERLPSFLCCMITLFERLLELHLNLEITIALNYSLGEVALRQRSCGHLFHEFSYTTYTHLLTPSNYFHFLLRGYLPTQVGYRTRGAAWISESRFVEVKSMLGIPNTEVIIIRIRAATAQLISWVENWLL